MLDMILATVLRAETLEILDSVEAYYNNAFNRAITVIGSVLAIGLLVVGVAIPAYFEWRRRQTFEKVAKEQQAEIREYTKKVVEKQIFLPTKTRL